MKISLRQLSSLKIHFPKLNKVFFSHAAAPEKPKKSAKDNVSVSHKFHEIYIKEIEKLQKSHQAVTDSKFPVKSTYKNPSEAYQHPYHSDRFPIYWSTKDFKMSFIELMGTEPVSPHYESFTLSRRVPILAALWILGYQFLEGLNLNSFYGRQAVYEVYSTLLLAIGITEMRFLLQKIPAPRLTWYYQAFRSSEYLQMAISMMDKAEDVTKKYLVQTKEQIDYYLIHKEFLFIKKRLLSNFLENETVQLNNHFQKRTVSMLNTIQNLENSNIKNKVKEISEETMNAIIKKVSDSHENTAILDSSFKSALEGLKSGKMEYKGDKIVDEYMKELNSRTSELKNLSPEAENKMFSLTKEQRSYVIEADARARKDYLLQPPDVNTAIKNSEIYKGIVSRMKSRVQGTFKA